MTDDADDHALKSLYRQSRHEQPSAQVDSRIRLAAAAPFRRRQKRWIWGLSTAAVMVLSFSLLLELFMLPTDTSINGDNVSGDLFVEKLERSDSELSERKLAISPPPVLKKPQLETPGESSEADQLARETIFHYEPSSVKSISVSSASSLQIPILPLQLDRLLALDDSLTGMLTDEGRIQLYRQQSLILQIIRHQDGHEIEAYPGSEILGVRVNWQLQTADPESCASELSSGECWIDDQVVGVFENGRLEYIRWKVSHD